MATFRVIADFKNGVKIEKGFIEFIQEDMNTCKLEFDLKNNNLALDLTSKRVTFTVETPSKATIEETHLTIVDAVNGKAEIVLPSDMILEAGTHKGQLQLYPNDSYARESTVTFSYSISPSLMTDKKLVASSRFGTLEGLILTVEGLQSEVDGNIAQIEKAAQVAENAKHDATMSASYSIQSANSAKEAAQAAATMTGVLDQVVEQAKQSATASTESAQASKASADEADRAANTALAATDKANAAIGTANNALANANTALVGVTEAKEIADAAAQTATAAAGEATNAVTIVNQNVQKVEKALVDVQDAVNTSNTAIQEANIANNTAQSSIGRAEAALIKSDEIVLKVNTAITTAENVLTEANQANLAANKAVIDATNQANQAKEEALKAKTEADKAKIEADRAKIEVDSIKGAVDRLDAKDLEQDGRLTELETNPKGNTTIDGKSIQNLDFIEGKVVQEGLEYCEKPQTNTIVNTKATYNGILLFDGLEATGNKMVFVVGKWYYQNHISLALSTFSNGNIYFRVCDGLNADADRGFELKGKIKHKNVLYYNLDVANKTLKVVFNGELMSKKIQLDATLFTGELLLNLSSYHNINYDFVAMYNRQLSPQEIAHNFQVLNNSPSITGINADGKEYAFSTDSSHVICDTGYNIEETIGGIYEACSTPFSGVNGKVEIGDAINKSKILMSEISGSTVKNLLKDWNNNDWYKSSYLNEIIKFYGDKITINSTGASSVPITIEGNVTRLGFNARTEYFITMFIEKNTLNKELAICESGGNSIPESRKLIPIGTTGIFKISFTTQKSFTNWRVSLSQSAVGEFVASNIIVTEKEVNISKPIPFGLTSTEATIEANSTKHSFYEPTIKGETKVVDGKLVSLESTDASLPKLGSVPSVSDTLDLASGVLVENTGEYIFNGLENIREYPSTGEFYRYSFEDISVVLFKPQSTASGSIWGDSLDPISHSNVVNLNAYGVGIHNASNQINFVTNISTLEGFKVFINGKKIRYQLATPTITQLTQAQVDTYSQHKKVILLNGSGGSNSSLELTEDGECIWVDKYKKFLLNGSENFGAIIENVKTVRVALGMTQHGVKNMANGNCDKIPYLIGDSSDTQHCRIDGSGGLLLWINKSNLNSLTLDGVKEFISKNNILLELELATPTTTHIPKSLTPTIPLGNKINTLQAGGGVSASDFKGTYPKSPNVIARETNQRLAALENLAIQNNIQ